MSYQPNAPWDRDRFSYEPPRPSKGPLIVVIAVLAFFGAIVIAAGIAIVVIAQNFPSGDEDKFAALTSDLDTSAPPHAQHWEQVRTAFSSAGSPADRRRAARLEELLNEFIRCTNEDDDRGLQKVVDYSRFFREMRATRFRAQIVAYDRPTIMRNLIERVQGISGWENIRVVHLEKLPEAGEVLVYAHGYHRDGYSNPVRFWVVDRGRPLVFDWEMTEYGSRETGDWSVYYAYNNDPRMNAYYRAREQIAEADTQRANGEHDAARRTLLQAATASVPPVLHDQLHLAVAYTHLSWQDPEGVLAAVERMNSPDGTPGSHLLAAQAHARLGDRAASLAAVDRFESVVGITPQSISVRVGCLEQQEQYAAAAEQYARLLQLLPDDVEVLRKWGLMLGEAEKRPLADHVRALPNAKARAKELARTFADYGDVEAAQAMANVLRPHAEHAPWVEFVAGYAKQADADHAGAAAHYRKLLESDDEELRNAVEYRWYTAMAAQKQFLAAYEQSPDPEAAFMHYVEGYEEGESSLTDDDFAALVAAHRQKMPNEPWGYYYASIVASSNKQYDDAERLLREGLAKIDQASAAAGDDEDEVDDYTRESFASQLRIVLVDAGRALDAYATLSPADETFRELANILRYREDTTAFLQLIDTHAAAHPDDPWLSYYRACHAHQEERYADASRLLHEAQASDAADVDEDLARWRRQLQIQIRQDQGEYLVALGEFSPIEETFDTLARGLQSPDDRPKLVDLIEAYERERGADDARAIYWRAMLLRAQNDDAALAQLLVPWPQVEGWQLWESRELRSALLAALQRLGRGQEARQIAQAFLDEHDDPWPLVRACIAAGESQQALELIERHRDNSYRLHEIYRISDGAPDVWKPQFAELRRRHPPPLTSDYPTGSAVIICSEAPQLTSEQLRTAISPVLTGDVQIVEIADEDDAASHGALATAGDTRVAIAWGGGHYQFDVDSAAEEIDDETLKDAWRKHQGWIAIDIFSRLRNDGEAAHKLAARIAAKLPVPSATAIHVLEQLLPATDATRDLLTQGWQEGELEAAGAPLWIYRELEEFETSPWNRRSSLRELDRQFREDSAGASYFVQVQLVAGDTVERPWLRLVRVIRPGHRDRSFVAEFVEPSVLQPHFTTGEHVRLDVYEITNWKRVAGEETTYARTK